MFAVRKRDQKFQQAFGRHLRKLREERQWTQMDLSAVSRVNETQISKIESGDAGLTVQTLRALALALGKYPSELLEFEFEYKLNQNFNIVRKRPPRPGTTGIINKLVEDKFLNAPKSVADVVNEARVLYNVNLPSADTSGALLNLVKKKVLKRIPAENGKYLYQKK